MVANTPLIDSDTAHSLDDVDYDPRTETYHVQYDLESPSSVSNTVVTAVVAPISDIYLRGEAR